MKFEKGKYYKHVCGELYHILGRIKTTMWGNCLVAESNLYSHLFPVGSEIASAENWSETTVEEWEACFSE